MSAGAGEASLRAAARFSRYRRQIRVDRRVLRSTRGVALVRAQRRVGLALPVSRLEIRRERPVHRRAVGAARERLLPADQAQVLPADRTRARAVGLPWSP